MNAFARSLVEAADPVALARRIGMEPDDWQREVLRSAERRVWLCCHRQAGKSSVAALAGMHAALYEPGSLILIFAPSQRQATEVFRTCLRIYRSMSRPVAPEAENALSLSLENGSRIVSLPGDEKTVRGYSAARLIIVDEAARVSDELFVAVRPILAVSGGRLLVMSTPFGKRGWFYEASRQSGWARWTVPATECARISPEFLAEERASMGDWMFRQEYLCEFVDTMSSFFDGDDISRAFAAGVERLRPEVAA